jgi:hypothetical protein
MGVTGEGPFLSDFRLWWVFPVLAWITRIGIVVAGLPARTKEN